MMRNNKNKLGLHCRAAALSMSTAGLKKNTSNGLGISLRRRKPRCRAS